MSPGTPVAALSIPRLGLDQAVVVEGTSAQDLTLGPGHRRDTVLPGQTGVSVIYGRRVSFGGPFEHLMQLQVGDVITTTTGQGRGALPRLVLRRRDAPRAGQLGEPARARHRRLDRLAARERERQRRPADDTAAGRSGPAGHSGRRGQHGRRRSDASALPALLWSQACCAIAILVPFAAVRWSPVATYLCAAPLVLAVRVEPVRERRLRAAQPVLTVRSDFDD